MFLPSLVVFLFISLVSCEPCGIPPCSDGATLPVPWHTGQYVVCRGSSGYLRHCDEGEYFDAKNKACVPGASEARTCDAPDGPLEHRKYQILSKLANRLAKFVLEDLTLEDIEKNIDDGLQKESRNIEAFRLRSIRSDNISERCRTNSHTVVKCPEEQSYDGLMPHPDDCHLFYYCIRPDLPPVCRDCPAELHFNPIKHVCDNPEVAGCTAGQATTTDAE